jgi:hypothetical protein
MATMDKATAANLLQWADKQLASNGGNSRPSNWDKATAPFIIGKYKTWQEVYDAAYQQYVRAGATDAEIRESTPNQVKKEAVKKKKADAVAAEAEALSDPFGAALRKYNFTVDVDENGSQQIRGIEPGEDTAVPMYLYTSPSVEFNKPTGLGRPSTKIQTPNKVFYDTDYNKVRDKILLDARVTPGGMDSLFLKLYNTGGISKETYNAKNVSAADFNKSLKYLVDQYSIKIVDDYKVYGKIEPLTFNKFLEEDFKGAGKTSKTTYDMVQTTRQDAADEANQFFMQYFGRGATKQEHDEYYKMLRDAEQKAIRYTTTTAEGNQVTKGQLLTDTDRMLIMGKVAGNALKGTDIDTVMKGGAVAAQNVDYILDIANQYGVRISRQQAMNYVANNLRTGQDINSTKQKIVEIAKSNYKGIADKISDNVSVKELAGNYLWQKAQTLELSEDTIDVFDADIQDAVNGTMTMTDFKKKLRQNPKWAQTKNAKEEAANYATDILKSFGLMA